MLNHIENPPNPDMRPNRSPSSRGSSSARKTPSDLERPARRIQTAFARKVCVVAFRSGEAVVRHPDLKCYLDDGWIIESAVPQLADTQQVELLVVLGKHDENQIPADNLQRNVS